MEASAREKAIDYNLLCARTALALSMAGGVALTLLFYYWAIQ
jgi:hypothetical protein